MQAADFIPFLINLVTLGQGGVDAKLPLVEAARAFDFNLGLLAAGFVFRALPRSAGSEHALANFLAHRPT